MPESIVLYFFQGEPGESLESPNAFMLPPLSSTLTFGKFIEFFPVRHAPNSLHFRFKMEDKVHGYVWRDIRSPTETIPVCMGVITAKILKMDDLSTSKRKSRLRRKKNADDGAGAAKQSSHANGRSTEPYHDDADEDVDADGKENGYEEERVDKVQPRLKQAAKAQPKVAIHLEPPPKPAVVEDMFSFDDVDEKSPSARSNGAAAGSTRPSAVSPPTAVAVAAAAVSPRVGTTEGRTRDELKAAREKAVQDNVQKALEFKQELDESARKETEDMDAAKEKHDKSLNAWATNNKQKRNVRTLLSTMHTVLWPGHKWKEIGLGDLIEPRQVKLQYRKAMLVVHTDKQAGQSAEVRFIAQRVFDAIHEAYLEFEKKESV